MRHETVSTSAFPGQQKIFRRYFKVCAWYNLLEFFSFFLLPSWRAARVKILMSSCRYGHVRISSCPTSSHSCPRSPWNAELPVHTPLSPMRTTTLPWKHCRHWRPTSEFFGGQLSKRATLVTRPKYPPPIANRCSNTPGALWFLWYRRLSLLHPHFFP